jgi:hypothetical protein
MTVKPKASQSTDIICYGSQYIYQIQPICMWVQLSILCIPGSLLLPLFKALAWIFLMSALPLVSPEKYIKHFMSSFGMDGLSHIHSDLTSYWIAELDDHVQCSRNCAYNKGTDDTKYNAWKKIKSLEETI